MEIKNLYEKDDFEDLKSRINTLTPETEPQWGKMNVAQMLAHCTDVQLVINGKPINPPFWIKLIAPFIKRSVLSNKPYKKNLPTAPSYDKSGKDYDFEAEKQRLLDAITVFYERKDKKPHPLFGKMTDPERGWAAYKHVDHHLTQFGV